MRVKVAFHSTPRLDGGLVVGGKEKFHFRGQLGAMILHHPVVRFPNEPVAVNSSGSFPRPPLLRFHFGRQVANLAQRLLNRRVGAGRVQFRRPRRVALNTKPTEAPSRRAIGRPVAAIGGVICAAAFGRLARKRQRAMLRTIRAWVVSCSSGGFFFNLLQAMSSNSSWLTVSSCLPRALSFSLILMAFSVIASWFPACRRRARNSGRW